MSQSDFQRQPTKKLKIAHLLSAQYNEDTKDFITIMGNVKRARFIATVIYKKFFPRPETPEKTSNPDRSPSARMDFTLDDGTGILRGIYWNATETTFNDIRVGDDVEVFGFLKSYREHPEIILDIVRRVDDPNYELLRDLEIKKQLKSNPMPKKSTQPPKPVEVPEEILNAPETPVNSPPPEKKAKKKARGKTKGQDSESGKEKTEDKQEISPELAEKAKEKTEVKQEISPEPAEKADFNMKDKIYEIILTLDSGNGVSFEEIQEDSHLDAATLKGILKTLEKETAIGETRPGFYQPL